MFDEDFKNETFVDSYTIPTTVWNRSYTVSRKENVSYDGFVILDPNTGKATGVALYPHSNKKNITRLNRSLLDDALQHDHVEDDVALMDRVLNDHLRKVNHKR